MHVGSLSPDTHTAAEVARLLRLEPLDREGGYFRRTAEAAKMTPDGRRAWSVIYSLLTPDGFSALHRLQRDELWFFHAGDPLESLRLRPDGGGGWVRLGLDASAGERAQDIVPAQVWQGTRLAPGGRWALVSCVVVPEFTWDDFELGERAALSAAWPAFVDGIRALTRTQPAAGQR
ncbi:MAG: cupin domain-containing protein [Opitutae bacterium]|nr:cupin domain-containing protein [Opitutae bacterium]